MFALDELYGEGATNEEGNLRWYFNPANFCRPLYKIEKQAGEAPTPYRSGGMGPDFLPLLELKVKDPQKYEIERERYQEDRMAEAPGQFFPLKDAQAMMDIAWPICIIQCQCRRGTRGLPDEYNRTCLALGPGMYKWERWPERYHGGVRYLTPEEAKDFLAETDRRGWVHLIGIYGAPFIGGICQCEYPECYPIRYKRLFDLNVGLKSYQVFRINQEKCSGCRVCVSRCQFGALNFNTGRMLANIDAYKCAGCGVCQGGCPRDAIYPVERESIPAVANDW